MLAFAAAVVFFIALVFALVGVSTGDLDLRLLGLFLLALHFAVGERLTGRFGRRR